MRKKTWNSSEKQGPGRRYWFDTKKAAARFEYDRRYKGYRVSYEKGSRTVWVPFAKKLNRQAKAVLECGLDPLAVGGYF